ncbi:alpha/beta hydrolase [Marivivens aquimaris]|uniref:alpha/beta hydrolase n=1 Tax=Marivivens aquimaris TaxID=2774876 RepID=UPI0018814B67|nr:alpha/beta hydrolase [Marivivens aquimaris]
MPNNRDDEFANGAYIEGAAGYPPRWQSEAAEFRKTHASRLDAGIPYGEGEREKFDLFVPEGKAKGLVVFVHGGYWLAFDRADWSHLAEGPLSAGYAVAMPSYSLCPTVRISDITRQIRRAISVAAAKVDGPIYLTGHSAGGHLVARMACNDEQLDWQDRLARVVAISPLADLAPLQETTMNEDLCLDPDEAAAESPVSHKPVCPVHVWVGANERPVFLSQGRMLADNWGVPITVEPDRHHFDVIDGLADAESALCRTLLA